MMDGRRVLGMTPGEASDLLLFDMVVPGASSTGLSSSRRSLFKSEAISKFTDHTRILTPSARTSLADELETEDLVSSEALGAKGRSRPAYPLIPKRAQPRGAEARRAMALAYCGATQAHVGHGLEAGRSGACSR